jgi:hypothetical protein
MTTISRRKLLERGVQISVGGAILATAGTAMAAEQKVCADPKNMDGGQKSIRMSLNYVEVHTDQNQACGKCGFYTADAANAGCGQCMIFTGPANAKGHCDSWAPKG